MGLAETGLSETAMAEGKIFTLANSNIQALAPAAELDFFDTQSVRLARTVNPLQAWRIIMSHPMPIMKMAFRIRNIISSRFGVKPISGFTGAAPQTVETGEMLDFFLVEYASEDVLTLTARDRHLDVMTCISTSTNRLTITSSVKTHNYFGRAYMLPVAPAHKRIVRQMLRRLQQQVAMAN